jgi:hypothetical protein
MLTDFWLALKKLSSRRPQRPRLAHRLSLESLEDRLALSGGPGISGGPGPTSGSSGSGSQPVAIVATSGSPGSSGGNGSGSIVLSGPGYPLAPSSGPARPDPSTLSQPAQTTVMVPLTGTPGGPSPSLAVVPVCTGGGPGSPPAG